MIKRHTLLFDFSGEKLGELKAENIDFPWILGEFIPSNKFAKYKSLFAREIAIMSEVEVLEDKLDSCSDDKEAMQARIDELEKEREHVEGQIDDLGLYIQDSTGDNRSGVVTIHIDGNKFEYK
jgi:peptidoglycan hydrolase CwlO-like protein